MVNVDHIPVPLHIRNPVQVDTAVDWETMRNVEHMDNNDLVMAWAALFAGLFSKVCDRYGVNPYVFQEHFVAFQNSITMDVEMFKWLASQRANADVGFAGIGRLIEDVVGEEYDEIGCRVGVRVTLVFPYLGEGDGHATERSVFFPDHVEENAVLATDWTI